MKSIILFSLLAILPFLSSCDSGTEMNHKYQNTISKIYRFNISDSSTAFLVEGFKPILLPQSNKMLFTYSKNINSQFKIYDFDNSESRLLADFWPFINNSGISSDENYVIFIKDNQLKRLNVNSAATEILLSSNDFLIDYIPPEYSSDGESIIYLSNKRTSKNNEVSDSIALNIYNVKENNSIQPDHKFLKNNDIIKTGFLEGSDKFYYSREGWDQNNHIWQIEFSIFNNSVTPEFFANRKIYPLGGYESKYFKYDQNSIIVCDNIEILVYDLVQGKILNRIYPERQFKNVNITGNGNYFVEIENNIIHLMNLNGEIINTFKPEVEDKIVWADFRENDNSIIFRTERTELSENY